MFASRAATIRRWSSFKMTASQIEADHIGHRIIASVFLTPHRHPGRLAGAIAIAPVEDFALVQHDGLAQPVRADVRQPSAR